MVQPIPTPQPSVTTTLQPPPVQPRSGPSPAELVAQRARQQLNQYRFLGYLTKGGESQAFLSTKNSEAVYIVKQGEKVEGAVQVRAIEPTAVVLSMRVRETGASIEETIPLTKEKDGASPPARRSRGSLANQPRR